MKTSIFDMNFTLPPLVKMTEMVKKMPMSTGFQFSHTECHTAATG